MVYVFSRQLYTCITSVVCPRSWLGQRLSYISRSEVVCAYGHTVAVEVASTHLAVLSALEIRAVCV